MQTATLIYIGNGVLALAAFALVFFGKVTWVEASVFIGALLVPSVTRAETVAK